MWKLEDDCIGLALSAKTYIKNIISKFEELLQAQFKPIQTPMAEDYHPKTDDSPLLETRKISKY